MSTKSRLVILVIFLSASLNLSAQSLDHQDHLDHLDTANNETNNYKVDIRIDPLLLAFSDIDIGIEFFIKKDMSFEVMLTYITRRMEDLTHSQVLRPLKQMDLAWKFILRNIFGTSITTTVHSLVRILDIEI